MEYTRDLGYCAAKYLLAGGNAAMISMQGGHFVPIPFSEMIDGQTGRTKVRLVDISSTRYAIARRYMIRLSRDDFEDPQEMARLAATAHLTEQEFRRQFEYLVAHEPPPLAMDRRSDGESAGDFVNSEGDFTMRRMLALSASTVLFVAGLSAAGAQSRPEAQREAGKRTVYVTVTDKNGFPVTDLAPGEFVVKEGGKNRDVLEAGMTNVPMKIALLVDDNGTGIFRYGVAKFIERLQGRAEFALSTVVGQNLRLVDYTADAALLTAAIGQLTARPGTNDGGQLLEGIFETAKDFQKRATRRPIIVVLTVGGEEHSPLPAHHVLDELEKSGAALHVIAMNSSALRATAAVPGRGAPRREPEPQ